ncbi:helix-turn-helix domain-containing protein [Oribacterium sp. C9]|uniref:helix-turn-helix domain-containing protein n=1 Tax=Oribacterium sp. C9 TaxID=1943579 RepID=UPI00210F3478
MDTNCSKTTSYDDIISYAPFWRTLKKKKISQYDLVTKMDISSSLLQKLRTDRPLTLKSIAMLCLRLGITPTDVFMFRLDDAK